MGTSLLSVERLFDGVPPIGKWFKVRSKKKGKKYAIVAKVVEYWLNAPKNKLTMLNLLCQSVMYGTAIGIDTATGSLSAVPASKFYAKTVIEPKQTKKIKGDADNGNVRGARRRASI